MAFRATADRISITDADDEIVLFDSDEGLFHATDLVAGSFRTQQHVARNNTGVGPLSFDQEHVLSPINPDADVVVGSFNVTGQNAYGVTNLGWFSATGSYAYVWDGRNTSILSGNPGVDKDANDLRAVYTFIARDGQLILHERVNLIADASYSTTVTIVIYPATFTYMLYCGRFT